MKLSVRFAGMAALTGLFLAGTPAFGQELRQVTISQMNGTVDVRVNGGEWQTAEPGMVLHEKDEIRTADGGFAELLMDPQGSTGKLELKEKSHLRLSTLALHPESGEKVTHLDLAIGKVLVHAEKLNADSKFEVRTPTAVTGVRGTIFEVAVEKT